MDAVDMDVDDENDWKAMDSDEEDAAIHEDEEGVERDDDIDIGFRSHQFQYGRKRKRSRQENQDEAIYGVFNDNNEGRRNRNSNSYSDNAAPMFVPASRSKPDTEASAPMFVAATKKGPENSSSAPTPMFVAATKTSETSSADSGLMFVAASSQTKPTEETDTTATSTIPPTQDSKNNITEEEKEEEERISQEQKEADDRFKELLEKAKARNKKTRTRPRPLPSSSTTNAMQSTDESTPSGLGMTQGLGLPSSFGGIGGGGGLGFSDPAQEPMEKDPTVGTWEKHTKGFGSKLLSKMGWKGSGGLGSNRRTFRGEAESKKATTEPTADESAAPPPAAAAAKVKKGISRPVEVVVRPNSMGLGFGNFKESSQLKANRRIEAEVRGIDYDAQLAKEKKEARAKRRQQRRQRYGNQYDSSSSEDEEHGDSGSKRNLKSSAIPTTDDLLSKQSWKAKRSKNRKHKSGLPEIIPYQELIQRQKQASNQENDKVVIIDMRGPASKSAASQPVSSTTPVALGEELLYNLSFLLGTYENKLHSSSRHHETSIVRTIEGLDHQIRDAEDRLSKAAERRAKLAKAHQIAEAVRTQMLDEPSNSQRKRVHALVSELKDVFTPSERKELQFWNVLAPTLLGPIMQSQLENWSPFVPNEYGTRNANRAVVDSFFGWAFLGEKEGRVLCESMVKNQLIPKLKADIESETMGVWDPVADPYVVLDLYEYLRTKALAFDNKKSIPSSGSLRNGEDDDPNQIFPSNREDNDPEDVDVASSSNLAEYIQITLIREAVYPKLLTAITTWKPKMVGIPCSQELGEPLHTWVLPWLPHIDHPILLPNLLVECKRKLKQSILKLQGKFGDADPQDIVNILRPWCGVLDAKSLQKLLIEDYNFSRSYEDFVDCAMNGDPKGDNKDWKDWRRFLFELHGNQLLSDIDFLSLVEEFLGKWAVFIQHFLGGFHKVLLPLDPGHFDNMLAENEEAGNALVVEQVLDAYRECKVHIFLDPYYERKDESLPSCSRSLELLRNDSCICQSFYGVAKMIQMYLDTKPWRPTEFADGESNDEFMKELEIFMNDGKFNAIRKRRFTETAEKNRAKAMGESRGESRAKAVLRKRNILEPTFREVVEAFASDRGVIFRPKAGAAKDGKPIYLFGNKSIYLEGDVVFYQDDRNKNISWRPISLDQLGAMAS